MAAFERSHRDEALINMAIKREVLPHRSLEAIKGKRRSRQYQALLESGDLSMQATPVSPPPLPSPENAGSLAGPLSQAPDRVGPSFPEIEGSPTASVVPPRTQGEPADELRVAVTQLSVTLDVQVPMNTEDIQSRLDDWSPPRPVTHRPSTGYRRLPSTTRGRRRCEYALFQKAWKRDRGRVTRRVVAGNSLVEEEGAWPEGTSEFWKALFERPSPPPVPGEILPIKRSVEGEIWKPISEEDVRADVRES